MPIGWGEFFALSSAISWALAVVLFRRAGEALPPFELNLFKNVLGFALLVPTLLLIDGVSVPEYSQSEVIRAVLSGFLGIAMADTWYLRALNLMGASRTGIVASLLSPFVIVLSVLFLGESLKGWQIVGFTLVMAGILLVTWRQNRSDIDPASVAKGLFFGVGAVFLMAVAIVIVKDILETRPFFWTVLIRLTGGLAGMMIYLTLRRRWASARAAFHQPQSWPYILAGSFLGSYVTMLFWLAGYRFIPASVASILNESANAWIVLFAWLILGEYIGGRKILGLALTLAGVATMLLV
jgi:uncharacterized membrane protein